MIRMNERVRRFLTLALVSVVIACASMLFASDKMVPGPVAEQTSKLVLVSEVNWEQLNPARGDQSPKAATIWGDRTGTVPTGFLVTFVDGFSSPPHIHNVSYRGVVISGLIHNDDPDAAEMWMPVGSFWTQPAGEVHITAAKGSNNVAYIEIEEGPYLVLPPEEAFDNGERPINLDESNIVWIDQPGMPTTNNGPKVAFLWGKPNENQMSGTLIKLPDGFSGEIRSYGSTFRAVVIQGHTQYEVLAEHDVKTLEPGSYFSSKGESIHQVSSEGGEGTIIYVRTDGRYDIVPAR